MSVEVLPVARVPEVDSRTLGWQAVFQHTILVGSDISELIGGELELPEGHEANAYLCNPVHAEQELRRNLDEARAVIGSLDKHQERLLACYCNRSPLEHLQKAKKQSADDEPSWAKWLSEKASKEQLLDFLAWNVAMIERCQTDPQTQEAIQEQRREYKIAVRDSLRQGWLHPAAATALDAVDKVDVFIGDIFDTLLHDRGGYHQRGSGEVIIAGPLYPGNLEYARMELRRNIRRGAKHELNHAVLGSMPSRWLDEALTEHDAQSLDYGEWDIIDPAERHSELPGVYQAERRLLALLLQGDGAAPSVPAEVATWAYSEPEFQYKYRGQLRQDIDRAWGRRISQDPEGGVLTRVDCYVAVLEENYRQQGYAYIKAGELAAEQAFQDLVQRPAVILDGDPRRAQASLAAA